MDYKNCRDTNQLQNLEIWTSKDMTHKNEENKYNNTI